MLEDPTALPGIGVVVPCLVFAYWRLADSRVLLGGAIPDGALLSEPSRLQRLACFGIVCLPLASSICLGRTKME